MKISVLLKYIIKGIATENLKARVFGFNSIDILNKIILCCGAALCTVVRLGIVLAST